MAYSSNKAGAAEYQRFLQVPKSVTDNITQGSNNENLTNQKFAKIVYIVNPEDIAACISGSITGTTDWGEINGVLSNQTDLYAVLNELSGNTEKPSNTLTVAKSGGDYTSVKNALDYANSIATSGNPMTVRVYPGEYFENPMTIGSYVTLESEGQRSVIYAIDQNSDFITMNTESYLFRSVIYGPANASCVYMDGQQVLLTEVGIYASKNGIYATNGTQTIVTHTSTYICENGFYMDNGSFLTFAACSSFNTQNVLRANNVSTIIGASFAVLGTTTYAIRQDCSDSSILINGALFSMDNILANNWNNIKLSFNNNKEADESLAITQELHVGVPEKGYESVFGEGDSYTRGMLVYTYDNSTSAFTDISLTAQSASLSDFSFPNTSADTAIYMASSLSGNGSSDFLKHCGMKYNVLSAATKGSGEIVMEYWNGSSWVSGHIMETGADSPYLPNAENIFEISGSSQIRFDTYACAAWEKNDPVSAGTNYYWSRYRIISDIDTSPIFEQFKLHTSRSEFNSDGWLEYFGNARPKKILPWDIGLTEAANASPLDQDIFLSDNLAVGRVENLFSNVATDRIGFNDYLPLDLDTSTPVRLRWSVISTAADSNNIDWVIRWGYSTEGDNVYFNTGDAPTTGPNEQSISLSIPAPGAANTQKTYEVDIDFSKTVSRRLNGFGDMIWVTLERTNGDAHAGNVAILNLKAYYLAWCDGGHVV